jgi:hypothetical protein
MHKTRVWIAAGCCALTLAVFAFAQAVRKPGLWEMTTTITWQQSPLPPGMTMPAGANSPFAGSTHTTQVCLTQQMIDKYGAPMPTTNGDCKISNVALHATGMSADMVCTGRMNVKATMESSWADGNVARGKVHFVGTMQAGPNTRPIEYTMISQSVYKGPDCGSVQPQPMPK